ncbi:uncharacterized protein MONOS_3396 [Monocercomonoides exilis]|uniref:uncharacterized protein n=1 Tax=Monocercomonoides exilis TaxID=2049356 RepID=UPI00355A0DB9|nr:hypothetical protein MONOS_3396 [Monocercomonoides exilis]|eukprot:MONOS_3396.1-p1 / transcript=MONOS_3396.1 / gene=MONOS_3396 / organism=Monocercomonoides_exilis_PA203 / gene_product=unspecified product / transcript_product=unspecified product / location=Mono_scaffold00079:135989-136385(+) / protein_length=109 / sequence_SO=supercontig / SO=protein_coding / is_pseudo=false
MPSKKSKNSKIVKDKYAELDIVFLSDDDTKEQVAPSFDELCNDLEHYQQEKHEMASKKNSAEEIIEPEVPKDLQQIEEMFSHIHDALFTGDVAEMLKINEHTLTSVES